MMPINALAAVNFNGYYCSSKHDLGDGTFYMTCYIVVTSDEEINQVNGTLILTNVNLESIIGQVIMDFLRKLVLLQKVDILVLLLLLS